jgi:ADP-ribose pyrophosphatase
MLYWLPPLAVALSASEAKPVQKRARILKSKTIFRGKVVELKVERVVEPGGVETTREVVCHPGSVVVIPHLPDGRLLLVRQYRHPVRESLWELVAGSVEKGETPRQGARRELREETGYHARVLKPLLEFYPSPGILSEKMHLVEARDLIPSKGQPDPDERIEIGFFTVSKLMEMIRRNEIRDGKTLVGILLLFGPALGSARFSSG